MRSLNALHLGNWLTDVSQAVDPVAYCSASLKVKGGGDSIVSGVKQAIEKILDELLGTIFSVERLPGGTKLLRPLKEELAKYADQAKEDLNSKIDFFLGMQANERDSRLAVFFRSAFLVRGYYKFVHPNAPGQQPRMNFECFMRVFGRPTDTRGASGTSPATDRPGAYTQYYPHEHLDRPEILSPPCLPQDPPVFAPGVQTPTHPMRLEFGKQPGTRSSHRKERLDPDLYSYLRDQIEMTAGLLAEVDLAFERVQLEGPRDDDPEWYLTLAKLGHALHQVEDFFAHSNWTELAAKRLGNEFLSRAFPPRLGPELVDRAYTTYQKRLKRHLTVAPRSWLQHPEETWVVTGYFDIHDTLISLLHIAEELWGGDVPDPYAEAFDAVQTVKETVQHPRTVEYEVQKAMRETLEFLTDPKSAIEDPDNDIAQKLRDKYEPDLNKLRRPGVSRAVAEQVAREVPPLQGAPPEVRDAFFNVIVEGSRAYTIGRLSLTIYQTINQITEFIKNPLGWLIDWLPDYLKEKLQDALKYYAKERVYDLLGADRIGCHSLLAKDHKHAPLYEQQKECATAVHWYIVNTLLRRPSGKSGNYVDWLELLEYFLRNPLPPERGSYREVSADVPVTLIHTVAHKEQLKNFEDPRYSLEDLYKWSAFEPHRFRFNWRTIADANFGTKDLSSLREVQDTINQILHDSGWGVPVKPPNYAFKPGVRILIPQQRMRVIFRVPIGDDPSWFKEVLEKDWTVFKGYENPETQTSEPPLQHHSSVFISGDELALIINNGKDLRRKARENYSPTSNQAMQR